MARLNIDWPAESQDFHPKSKLEKCFLQVQTSVSGPAIFFQISTPRCRDRGRNHYLPMVLAPRFRIEGIPKFQMGMGRCLRRSRCLRAISPLTRHHPLRPRPFPSSHSEQLRLWLGRHIWLQVRPMHICTLWEYRRLTRPTC